MRTLLFILAAFFCRYQSIAQLSKTSVPVIKSIYTIKGDYYSQYQNYVLAINTYSKAVNQNPKEVSAMLGMADAYHQLGQDNLADQWYRKAFAINPDVDAQHILKYIEILSKSGNSAELKRWVSLYNNKVTKSGEPMDSVIFVTENLSSLNSKGSDSAPVLYDNKIIFSSDRTAFGNFNSYKSTLNSEGIFGEVSSFHGSVNSGRTEGGFAIATNAATLFFTGTEKESTTTPPAMEIFTSAIPAGPSDQLKVNKLAFKNFDHSKGQPAVNSKGTMLYFAAHSPKQTKGFDLYHSQYNGKKWSPPVALGASINSHGDELYPVLVNDSILYFASNGHGGLGGFDIFKINLKHTHHHQPEHLPAPINTPADEFGFVMNSTGSESYLSSNRPGGQGGNDLYRIYFLPFKKKKHDVAPKQEELFIYTAKGDEIKISGTSKENLKFDFQPGQKYNLVVEYDNSRTGTTQSIKNATSFTKLNVYTFDIQKSSEPVYDQKSRSKQVQDIHINPGDLVTFQLIPNMIQDPDADMSKIQFQKSEVAVADGQSIVFSYVAEGGPSIPEGDLLPVADISKLDTASNTQPQVAPTSSVQALATTTPSQKITTPDATSGDKSVNPVAVPVQSTAVNAKDPLVAGKEVETQQEKLKSEQTPSGNKVASTEVAPTQVLPVQNKAALTTPLVVAATTGEKNPSPSKNVKDTTLNKPSVPANKNVETKATEATAPNKVASTEVTPTQALPQNKAALTTPLVVAATSGEKNPTPSSKSVNDTTSNKPSVTANKNVDTKAMEPTAANKVASTEVTPTHALPVQNNAAQVTVPVNTNPVSNTTDIQYRVQVAASTSKLTDDQLKKIYTGPKEISYFSEEGYHKYYIEQTPSFPAAKRTMKESGVEQAFIAAYQGDKKLNLQEAITLQKKATSQTASSITRPQITNSAIEPLSVVNIQPNNSTEVVAEKSTPITTDDGKEKQVAVIPVQNTTLENKLPVSGSVPNEPVAVVNAQATNEVHGEKIVPVIESSKEKEAVAVTQSSQNATQSIATENKLPVGNSGTDKPASIVNKQSSPSAEVKTENLVTTEKQAAVVVPSTQKTSTNVPAPEIITQDNAMVKKPSVNISGQDDFLYRVQIAASEIRLSDANLKKIYHGDKEVHTFKEEGKYKYYVLETPNYFVADQTLKKINVDHAFISAYKKDVKVPLEEAINVQYKVPVIKENLTEVDSIVKITTVNFSLDEFELQPEQLERLRSNVISELRSNPSYRAIVNGYTDIRGSETYNFGLSQERALFVDQQVVAEGIDAARVTMRYFGESQLVKYCPEHENCDESIHQANRRVEILLIVDKK